MVVLSASRRAEGSGEVIGVGIKFADDIVGVTIGCDLGKQQDFTAISVAESQLTGQDESFTVRHLERAMLGTDYTRIAIRLAELHDKLLEAVRAANTKRLAIKRQGEASQTIIGEPEVYIDATGLGGPFIDFLRRESPKLRIVAVTITSGDKDLQQLVDAGYDKLHVGKEALVGRLQVLLGSGRIKIPSSETGKALQEELRVFRRKLSKSSGHANYGAEEGSHDDLVIATALSVWKRARNWQERIQLWR